MLLSRYNDMNYIQNLDIVRFSKLVKKAQEKTEREELFKFYCSIYPHLEVDKRIPFNEFVENAREPEKYVTVKSNDEIMDELLNGRGD